ncbi:isochorismatase hydrolase [Plectosphaerella cucumerina]|uniref:Isochorismatase hydrolase n=1 Tax=Plectosphaerella cucumerina TaxID=40658 RepID=A0A8K0TM72_9PEZI|nr:isochorismatase hydrolase [Plectosphaerella cucumerina]
MKPASETPTALLLIDIQKGFEHPTHWGTSRSTPSLEANVAALLRAARQYNKTATEPILIIHVHHHSVSPTSQLHPSARLPGSDTPTIEAADYAAPVGDEPILTKNVNSGFVGTDLEERLRGFGAKQLVVVGLTTDHCVSTTVRMAANLHVLSDAPDGDGIFMVRDATATYSKGGFDAETVHAVHLASLDGEFASVVGTDEVVKVIFH